MSETSVIQDGKYANFSREELLAEIQRLKKTKKYGLVWEHKTEQVIEDFKNGQQPYLEEVTDKRIENAKDEPTNLIIEGDNFDALSVLSYTHAGKIDVIYIDPPYNTGNQDFIYNDSYVDIEDAFRHSKWLSFMAPRLRMARDLLKNDGVLFVSIDGNEQAALKLLCDGIFGQENFIMEIPRKTTEHIRVLANYELQNLNDSILVYANSKANLVFKKKVIGVKEYKYQDSVGEYMLKPFQNSGANGTRAARPNLYYSIYYNERDKTFSLENSPEAKELLPKKVKNEDGRWLWSKDKFLKDNKKLEYRNGTIYRKEYSFETEDDNRYEALRGWFDQYQNRLGAASLKELGMDGVFSYSKPPQLIKALAELHPDENAVILDFFAGSGTTGQAILELNREDGGHRQFILCTNNGDKGPDSTKIAEDITYPRIKTVITGQRQDGSKYSDGIPANLRYYKINHREKKQSNDATRQDIANYLDDIIMIKENAFEFIEANEDFGLYKNSEKYLGIVMDPFSLEEIVEKLTVLNADKLPVKLYVFSYSRDAFEEDFETDFEIEFAAMPEGLLKTYANIIEELKKEDA